MTKFNQLNEDEKNKEALGYAMIHCQNFIFNPISYAKELKQYREEMKSMIDWLAIKLNMQELPLYPKDDDEYGKKSN